MAGHPVCSRSWRAWMTAQASATDTRPSDAGGNAPCAARPSSATFAAQAAEEAPGGQPSATCARESRMQPWAAPS
eukprot:11340512-Alexandrium_andersonii.AAC.1